MCHSLGKHGLACARGTVQQDAPGWVNPNLSVQLMVRQGQLNRLLDLLFLNVIASNILKPQFFLLMLLCVTTQPHSSYYKERICADDMLLLASCSLKQTNCLWIV